MKNQIKKHKELLFYITELDNYRGEITNPTLSAARTFFEVKDYELAIQDIKKYFGIPPTVKLLVQRKLSLEVNTGANITIPAGLFQGNYIQLHNRTYVIQINPSSFNNFSVFAKCVIHELAHLKLFLDGVTGNTPVGKKAYWDIEKAVDTLAILYGFGEIYLESRNYCDFNRNKEYINDEEFLFIYKCFKEKKKFNAVKKKKKWYQKILQKIQI